MKVSYLPNLLNFDPDKLKGKLIVIEGADGSGRSTQIGNLVPWLEDLGHYVVNVGIKRSSLVSEELNDAQKGNILSQKTMSLFYATDFADQLENTIIPSLMAGAVVLCDRYIYTLMARNLVRGDNPDWVEKLFGFALIPDIVFYLKMDPKTLLDRNLEKDFLLHYWESGMDMGLSSSIFDSFLMYQDLMIAEFLKMNEKYRFNIIDGNQSRHDITECLKEKIATIFG